MKFEYRPTMGRPMKEVLADLTFKQKAQYIWQFYKLYILAALFPIIVVAGAFLWSALDQTEMLYNGIAVSVNLTDVGEDLVSNELFDMMGGTNHKKQYVNFKEMDIFTKDSVMETDSASSNVMTIAAWMSVGDVDYLLLCEDSFEFYKGDIFWDLEEMLTQEQQAVWRDRFVEMPDEFDEPFFGAIDITDTYFAKQYITTEGKIYIAFPGKAMKTDKTALFLDYILSLEE